MHTYTYTYTSFLLLGLLDLVVGRAPLKVAQRSDLRHGSHILVVGTRAGSIQLTHVQARALGRRPPRWHHCLCCSFITFTPAAMNADSAWLSNADPTPPAVLCPLAADVAARHPGCTCHSQTQPQQPQQRPTHIKIATT